MKLTFKGDGEGGTTEMTCDEVFATDVVRTFAWFLVSAGFHPDTVDEAMAAYEPYSSVSEGKDTSKKRRKRNKDAE